MDAMDQDCRKPKDMTIATALQARSPRRPRRSAEETREEILNTAESLFRTHGYASVAIADIAAALSMSPANVFKHFRTKTSLVDAIATRAIEKFEKRGRRYVRHAVTVTDVDSGLLYFRETRDILSL